jgi:hypothetical protein
MDNHLNKITIIGGGSAGWMTASTLIKAFPNKKITLIESPNTPTVGVGESTIGGIRNWTSFLEINDKQFLASTDGSYKLSIKFTDFYKKGEAFHYPFGEPDYENHIANGNDWWFKKYFEPTIKVNDYADCMYPQMALVNQNKLFYNEKNEIPFKFYQDTAFHFDATKFGIWLKDTYCIPKGVRHIKEDIVSIETNEEGIKSLNKKHKADLFIDCTGFKALLIDKTLKEPFESYQDLLPNNSAWATRIPYKNKEKELVSYTNCTAYNNGWIWNIPLWSRIGTGYVYSDKFIDDDSALKEFQKYLGNKELEFKKIKMRVGIHKRLWVKNVCAIGLAAGFIEPLESNGLYSVHQFLMSLVRNLQRDKVSQWDKDNFTYECKRMFRTFAEFVAMHYAFSHRDDTPYWKANFNKQWSNHLINLEPFIIKGLAYSSLTRINEFNHCITGGGVPCIAAGMHWSPTDLNQVLFHNITDKKQVLDSWKNIPNVLNDKKENWNKIVKNKLSLFKFLKKEIYNNVTKLR